MSIFTLSEVLDFPIKLSLVVDFFGGGSYRCRLFDGGRIMPSGGRQLLKEADVLPMVRELVERIIPDIERGGALSVGLCEGVPSSSCRIEFYAPAGGRKEPTLAYAFLMGGTFEKEEDPLILPLPGLDRSSIPLLGSDDLHRPLILSVLKASRWAIESRKIFTLLQHGQEGEGQEGLSAEAGPSPFSIDELVFKS